MVIVEPVTAEIFLIWTIVARTNVAWTNVNMTVGICSRGSQKSKDMNIQGYQIFQVILSMYSGVESTVPGGWVAGWLDQMEIRLTSASVEVEVELS